MKFIITQIGLNRTVKSKYVLVSNTSLFNNKRSLEISLVNEKNSPKGFLIRHNDEFHNEGEVQ